MKRAVIVVLLMMSIFMMSINLIAQEMRPIRDDVGYSWNPANMNRFMDFLKANPLEPRVKTPPLIAAISPHDDYLYAGKFYYDLFTRFKAKEVVIFGVTHNAIRKKLNQPQDKLIFEFYGSWFGPYRPVKISPLRDLIKNNLEPYRVIISNDAHAMEHSIEGMVPFLQYFNKDVAITPIMVTAMDFKTMDKLAGETADLIVSYIKKNNLQLGKDIFFLMSADANHYGKDFDNTPFGEDQNAHTTGTGLDQTIAHDHLDGPITREKIKKLLAKLCGSDFKGFNDTLWCGRYSIAFGTLTVMHVTEKLEKRPLKGKILNYSDTYSEGVLPITKTGLGITAPFSLKHWVGFFTAGFYL